MLIALTAGISILPAVADAGEKRPVIIRQNNRNYIIYTESDRFRSLVMNADRLRIQNKLDDRDWGYDDRDEERDDEDYEDEEDDDRRRRRNHERHVRNREGINYYPAYMTGYYLAD